MTVDALGRSSASQARLAGLELIPPTNGGPQSHSVPDKCWARDELHGSKMHHQPYTDTFERHYRIAELAQMWALGRETVRRIARRSGLRRKDVRREVR
jgi:hypothetical protein